MLVDMLRSAPGPPQKLPQAAHLHGARPLRAIPRVHCRRLLGVPLNVLRLSRGGGTLQYITYSTAGRSQWCSRIVTSAEQLRIGGGMRGVCGLRSATCCGVCEELAQHGVEQACM